MTTLITYVVSVSKATLWASAGAVTVTVAQTRTPIPRSCASLPAMLKYAPVQIASQKVVSIEYTLRDDSGKVLDSSEGREPLAYLHGAGNIVPGLEKALDGKAPGDDIEVSLTPEEGYGHYDAGLVQNVAVRKLPNRKAAPGMRFRLETSDGPRAFTVQSVRGDYAKLDGNHPLAGQTLHFKVKVVDVREPSAEETEHGHVHGPGGHDH
jgi:FKBP-type peptidyl-prolyl cis-trans isomerase SlyD